MQFIKQKIQSVIVSCGLALLLISPVGVFADSVDYDYNVGNSYDYSYDYNVGNSYNYDYGVSNSYDYNYDYGVGNSYDYNYDFDVGNSYSDYDYDFDVGNSYSYSTPSYEAPVYHAPVYTAPSYSTPDYDIVDNFVDYYTPQYQAPSYSAPQYQAPIYSSNQGYSPSYLADFGSGCYRSNCVDRETNNPPREEENFSVSCFATDSRVKIGETASFRAEVSGGKGSKTYSWSGIASGSGQSVTSSKLTSAGTKSATVTVKSGNLTRTANCSVTVEDFEPLEVSCIANPTRAEVDDSVSFVATARGGNGNYTYSWSGEVTGTSKVETETFTSKGTKTGVITVKSGTKTETASCSVTIIEDESDLGGTCVVSPENPIEDKDTVTWRASATGGNGNYTYEWHGDITGSGSIVRKEYSTDGTKTATVKITSDGKTIERTCSVYVKSEDDDEENDDDVKATCEVSPSVVRVGETVSFRGEGDGGDGDFEYRWSGDISSSSRTVERSFSTTGTKEVTLRVTSDGKSDTDDCTVNVRVVGGSSVTLLSNGGDTGTLSSGVFLSEIPYTGASSGTKIALFILGLALWSAVIAHILIKKRARKHGVSYKQAQSDIVADFKRQNMLKKGITA